MSAHLSDWHSGNPALSPGKWIAAFICVIIVYYLAMMALGTILHS
ncbi:MAG TPA: hypothetical protein VHD14_11160 [Pseudolabrys sp.]|nr:hypothetical protein [Pseudolabrys sp.]